jgi:tRNA U38,U39,U40 pseudouridine synthase TruA
MDMAYDGRPFSGFQSQKDGSGIQDHLARALALFFRHPVRVTGRLAPTREFTPNIR